MSKNEDKLKQNQYYVEETKYLTNHGFKTISELDKTIDKICYIDREDKFRIAEDYEVLEADSDKMYYTTNYYDINYATIKLPEEPYKSTSDVFSKIILPEKSSHIIINGRNHKVESYIIAAFTLVLSSKATEVDEINSVIYVRTGTNTNNNYFTIRNIVSYFAQKIGFELVYDKETKSFAIYSEVLCKSLQKVDTIAYNYLMYAEPIFNTLFESGFIRLYDGHRYLYAKKHSTARLLVVILGLCGYKACIKYSKEIRQFSIAIIDKENAKTYTYENSYKGTFYNVYIKDAKQLITIYNNSTTKLTSLSLVESAITDEFPEELASLTYSS